MNNRCVQCGMTADVIFSWCASMGPQSVLLCDEDARKWFDTYKNTPAGQSLSIESEKVKNTTKDKE